MTHEQPTHTSVDVTRMDHDRALEVFNDILCDMGNYVEFGAPHYKHEALETIASHCARHRIAHSAPAGEVKLVEAAKPFAELADFYDGPCEEHGENGCPDSAGAGEMLLDLTVGQFRALRAALAKHGGA